MGQLTDAINDALKEIRTFPEAKKILDKGENIFTELMKIPKVVKILKRDRIMPAIYASVKPK